MAPEGEGGAAQGEGEGVFDPADWDAPGEPSDLSALSAQTQWMDQQGGGLNRNDASPMTAPMMNELSAANQPVVVDDTSIIDVWAHNMEAAFKEISEIVQTHPYVAMDTEFPGVVARPYGTFRSHTDYQYQTLKVNVDLLRIIQLGLTFSDENGNLHERCTWQFHFTFDLTSDIFAQDSIDLLRKAGVDFEKHQRDGIDVEEFGGLMIVSGLTLCEDVRWISFHSYFDFGYLVKVLTNAKLPEKESDFFALLSDYFPCFFDIKYIMKSCESLKGGLNRIAETLEVKRVGPSHQAGSDSLVTSLTFFKMARLFFENNIDDVKYAGVLYGLGQGGGAPTTWFTGNE